MIIFKKEKKGVILDFSEKGSDIVVGVARKDYFDLAGISITDSSEGSDDQEIKKIVLLFDNVEHVEYVGKVLDKAIKVLEEQRSGRNEYGQTLK